MRNRRGQLDMAHALTPDLGDGDFNPALFADDALILHPLVLAAQTFVVLHRTKNARTKQAITLGLKRPIVDGFRLLDFAEGPTADTFRRGETDLDLIKSLWLGHLVGEFGQVVHRFVPSLQF